MTQEIHRRVYNVSHFQVSLVDAADLKSYPNLAPGGQLAAFGRNGVVAATAWDEGGKTPPEVEVSVSGYDEPNAAALALVPLASGEIMIGDRGALVGNVLTSDLRLIPVPQGRYRVLVSADALVPMTARRINFHLWPA